MRRFFEYLKHKFNHFITFSHILFSRTRYEFLIIFFIVIGFFLRVFLSFGCLIKLCDVAKRHRIEDGWHLKVQQIATKGYARDTEGATQVKAREKTREEETRKRNEEREKEIRQFSEEREEETRKRNEMREEEIRQLSEEREEETRKRSEEREKEMQALLDAGNKELDKISPLLKGDRKTIQDAGNKYHSDLKKNREKHQKDLAKAYEALVTRLAIWCLQQQVDLDQGYYEVFCPGLRRDARGYNLLFTFLLLSMFFMLSFISIAYGAGDPAVNWPQPKCRPRDRGKSLEIQENYEEILGEGLLSGFLG